MNDRRKRITAGTAAVILLLSALLLFLLRNFLIGLSGLLPECRFYKQTGFLCPACGNTRSVRAFLKGRFIESAGYNITPALISVFSALLCIELAAFAFGADIRVIPRRYWFLAVIMILLILYYILRNIFPFLTLCR